MLHLLEARSIVSNYLFNHLKTIVAFYVLKSNQLYCIVNLLDQVVVKKII
jgi:hypothetical protein